MKSSSSSPMRRFHLRVNLSNTWGSVGRGRYFSTESNKIDEPLKVQEAETINPPPPPEEKLLVLGGNGFVGSHICKEALDRGLSVASLSRSGKSSIQDPWATKVSWHKGDLLSGDSWKEALTGVTSVISYAGGFGSNTFMYKINGTANINAIRAAAEKVDSLELKRVSTRVVKWSGSWVEQLDGVIPRRWVNSD